MSSLRGYSVPCTPHSVSRAGTLGSLSPLALLDAAITRSPPNNFAAEGRPVSTLKRFSSIRTLGIFRQCLVFVSLAVLSGVSPQASAQPTGCDEGVIRLPDRSGTIQICSALAARVPELARQLMQATAQLGAQQAQIAELTRLVRGLNNVSRSIGTQRQAEMLQTLSAELGKTQQGKGGEALAFINDRLDGLQSSFLGALSDPKTAVALGEALRGPVGEAIAKLDLSGAGKQIEDMSEQLKAIEQRLGDVKADTGQIVQQVGRIESTLGQIAANFEALRQSAAIIPNPRRAEEFYSNALQYEGRGDMVNARESYRRYFETGGLHVDPVERYTRLLTATEGRSGAIEVLRGINRQHPSPLVEAYLQALASPTEAATLMRSTLQKHPAIGPLHFLLARQSGEERLGRQSLDDQQREQRALQAFMASHERGEVIRFFIDQRMAMDWIALAEASLKRLAGVERMAPTLSISLSNSGWHLNLQANEPVRRVFYREGPGQALVDMGQDVGMDRETGEPIARTSVSLPRKIDLSSIEFFYDDLSHMRRGPVKLESELTNPVRAVARLQKRTLEETGNSWVAFRHDMPIVYFTHLASYRCAIRELRWGWGGALDRILELAPCDPEEPFGVGRSNSFMVRFDPLSIKTIQVSLEVTYFDGTRSAVRSFEAPDGIANALRQAAVDSAQKEAEVLARREADLQKRAMRDAEIAQAKAQRAARAAEMKSQREAEVANKQAQREAQAAQIKAEREAEAAQIKSQRQSAEKEFKVRHILVEAEDTAKKIIAELKAGAKFEDLARQSRDSGSASIGGDLGWNTSGTFEKECGQVINQLGRSQLTEQPIKTSFGWHVIRVDDIRTRE